MSGIRKLEFEEIFSQRPGLEKLKTLERLPIYALVENIRSMHNVGSIFRSSDGVRLRKLYLSGFTAQPPRKEIDKTALGATESVPWEYCENPLPVLRELKREGVQIVTVEHTDKSGSYATFNYNFPLCLVMGNEVDGVSQDIVNLSDAAVEIPMLGLKQSLNVSVAYGIVLYHIFSRYENGESCLNLT